MQANAHTLGERKKEKEKNHHHLQRKKKKATKYTTPTPPKKTSNHKKKPPEKTHKPKKPILKSVGSLTLCILLPDGSLCSTTGAEPEALSIPFASCGGVLSHPALPAGNRAAMKAV